jgi:hypothetical protein
VAQPRLIRRPPSERVLAWIYTGPLGHLWGAVADISELWVRWRLSRASIRLRRIREQ